MVKFSKQLQGQLVPEWKSAYCNYWQLKKVLKQVKLHWEKEAVDCPRSPKRLLNSPLRSFGQFARRRSTNFSWSHNDMITVHCRNQTDSQEDMDVYETEVLFEPIIEANHGKAFFAKLDAELNKVNKFYKRKEDEHIKRSETLDKQMKALKQMGRLLAQQRGGTNFVFQDPDGSKKEADGSVQHTELTYLSQDSGDESSEERVFSNKSEHENSQKLVSGIQVIGEPQSLPIHNQIKINIPLTTPAMAIAALSEVLRGDSNRFLKNNTNGKDDILVSRKKVHHAEKMLRMAYVELYRELNMLKSYSSLNMVAFAKILKKYEKVTRRNASSVTYLRVVEGSYFNCSDKVVKLMDKIEALFTEQFTKDNRRQAMTFLRPTQQKASHKITFFLGLFTGCFLSLFAAFAMIVHISEDYISAQGSKSEQQKYMETIFPIFSMLSLILLHIYMYGWNVYAWRRVRINYAFIFEFAPRTELRNREILLVCTGLSTIAVGGMVTHLAAYSKYKASSYVDLIPLAVLMVLVALLLCPFNLFYRSSRLFFLRSMRHIILSPMYKVVLADFFLADQLTSQVPALRSMEYITCYYMGGHFKNRNSHACTNSRQYRNLMYIISLMPYWFRLMQCFRRWIDENDRAHIANGGKYLSAMVAVAVKLTYGKDQSVAWLVMLVITSTVATIYQLYWDLVVDWGLLQPYSLNPWLRDRLILKRRNIYFVSMVFNGVLRLAWLQSVTHLQFGDLNTQITDFIFASLEVVRRGHWNFYRIENEHLNNVGKYRAVKTVPLPFGDMEEYEV